MIKQKYAALFKRILDKNYSLYISVLNEVTVKYYDSNVSMDTKLDFIYDKILSLETDSNWSIKNLIKNCHLLLSKNSFETRDLDFLENFFENEIKLTYDRAVQGNKHIGSFSQFIVELAKYISFNTFRRNLQEESIQYHLENQSIEDYILLNRENSIPNLKFQNISHKKHYSNQVKSQENQKALFNKTETYLLASMLIRYIQESKNRELNKRYSGVDCFKVLSIISNNQDYIDINKIKNDSYSVKTMNSGFEEHFKSKPSQRKKFIKKLLQLFPVHPNSTYSFRDYIDNYINI